MSVSGQQMISFLQHSTCMHWPELWPPLPGRETEKMRILSKHIAVLIKFRALKARKLCQEGGGLVTNSICDTTFCSFFYRAVHHFLIDL